MLSAPLDSHRTREKNRRIGKTVYIMCTGTLTKTTLTLTQRQMKMERDNILDISFSQQLRSVSLHCCCCKCSATLVEIFIVFSSSLYLFSVEEFQPNAPFDFLLHFAFIHPFSDLLVPNAIVNFAAHAATFTMTAHIFALRNDDMSN